MSGFIPFNRKNRQSKVSGPFNMIDNLFNEAWDAGRNLIPNSFKIDVRELDNEYIIEAELPGVKKEHIDLKLSDGNLTISVNEEETSENKDQDDTYIHRERRYSSMQRSLYLADAKPEGIRAKLAEGLLEITVEKESQSNDTHKIIID